MQTPTDSEIVRLSVGGRAHVTTRTTLTSQPGLLAAIFSGEFQPTCLRDQEGSYFIDRDPTHFGTVLNYLRDGTVVLPAGAEARGALRQEAEFYNLAGLARAVDEAAEGEAARVTGPATTDKEAALKLVLKLYSLVDSADASASNVNIHISRLERQLDGMDLSQGRAAKSLAVLVELYGHRSQLLQTQLAAVAELRRA